MAEENAVDQIDPNATATPELNEDGTPKVNEDGTPVMQASAKVIPTIDDQINAKLKAPESLADKGYMKNIVDENGETTADKLFKEIDELQGLKGKKSIAFDYTTATEEQIQEHIASSRPENAEVYKVEGVAEALTPDIKNLFYENGVNPHEADRLVKGYLAIEQAQMAKLNSKEGFQEEMKNSFKENTDVVASATAKAMKASQDENDQKITGTLLNSQLGMVYRLVNTLIKDYGIDTKSIKNAAGGGGVNSVDGANKEVDASYNAITELKKGGTYTKESLKKAVSRWQTAQNNLRKLSGGK